MNKKVSVAIAAYNGEKYISQQLKSILDNLSDSDEVIVSDDGSQDRTLEIVRSFQDPRIKIIHGPSKGVVKNFENAISACSGDVIFLSDQDDVWKPGKVQSVLAHIEKTGCTCVIHDAEIVDKNLKVISPSYFQYRHIKEGNFYNIVRPGYLGCCMAFTKNMKEHILPIPPHIQMHDRWIGAVCGKYGKNAFLYKPLMYYRRHDENVSQMHRDSVWKIIKNRVYLLSHLLIR